MTVRHYSNAEARRIALAAQGFDRPRPRGRVDAGHVARTIRRLGLLQLDFVNVLVPAHRLIPFSRLGPYPDKAFDNAVYGSGRFTEQWAHEASIVPVDCWPLLAYRRAAFGQTHRSPLFRVRNYRRYLAEVLDIVRESGPCTSNDMPPLPGAKRKVGDWHRSLPRWALEHHFGNGLLAVADRLANFQRCYDLPERLVPQALREQTVDEIPARRELLARAAAALGIATARDLADYFRMTLRDAAPRIDELADAGVVREVQVEGWAEAAWLHHEARLPRRIAANALLSPFDPVVWYRPRAERLFDFHYRIEIYLPEPKRRWGYYVLPFLCDDRLAARVDLKAMRNESVLDVRAAHLEPGADRDEVAGRLAMELGVLSRWLQLDKVRVLRKGNLSTALRSAVARSV